MNTPTSELQEIYRRRVLEHSKHPRNFHHPEDVTHEALGFNPLCGDKLNIYLCLDNDRISDVAFEGSGCAISIASASMMTEAIRGLSAGEAHKLIEASQNVFSEGKPAEDEALKEVEALAGVSRYPSRIKCAALAWSTAEAALRGKTHQVSTE